MQKNSTLTSSCLPNIDILWISTSWYAKEIQLRNCCLLQRLFLMELSNAKWKERLINARIRLTPRVYLSQSESGGMPYNEIYGRHRRGLYARGFRRSAKRKEEEEEEEEEKRGGSPVGTGCNNYYRISIRLSFAFLHIEPPEESRSRSLYLRSRTTRVCKRLYNFDYAKQARIHILQSSQCVGCMFVMSS